MGNLTAWLMSLEGNLLAMVSGQGSQFVAYGTHVAMGLAGIVLAMFGFKAVQRAQNGEAMSMAGLAMLILKFAICISLIAGWTVGVPWLGGVSAGTFVPNAGLYFARLIGWSGAQQIASNVASWSGMEIPGTLGAGWLWYILAQILLFLDNIILFALLAGPLIIDAALVIVGPLIVPFWFVPEMTAIARGYLRCLIIYSLVPVIGAVLLNITANILLPSLSSAEGVAISMETAISASLQLCVALAVSIIAQLFIIKVANQICSGSGGAGLEWAGAALTAVGVSI